MSWRRIHTTLLLLPLLLLCLNIRVKSWSDLRGRVWPVVVVGPLYRTHLTTELLPWISIGMVHLLSLLLSMLVLLKLAQVLLDHFKPAIRHASTTEPSEDDGNEVRRHTSRDGVAQHSLINPSLLQTQLFLPRLLLLLPPPVLFGSHLEPVLLGLLGLVVGQLRRRRRRPGQLWWKRLMRLLERGEDRRPSSRIRQCHGRRRRKTSVRRRHVSRCCNVLMLPLLLLRRWYNTMRG